mgnify:CR=1 FL=1
MATDTKADVMEVRDGRLILDVPISAGVPSESGKSLVFFSTKGNKEINDEFVLGVNLYKKNRR